ncbi:MAG: CAP domain-containing protein [Eubacteriales bacterium]|nr:CAP domain-containing protein [Eubacteriales bacterium]
MTKNKINRLLTAAIAGAAVIIMTGVSAFAAPAMVVEKQVYINCEVGEALPAAGCETTAPVTPAPEAVVSAPAPETATSAPAPETAAPAPAPAANSSVSDIEREVTQLVNVIRAENGLGALTIDETLSQTARAKAVDMAQNNYFSHTSPTYGSPFDMMKQFGVDYNTAGENIAKGYSTAQAVVDGWMNSPGHRANILNASFTHTGVGYTDNGNHWAQMFIG